MLARLTPDQKVACSNHVGVSIVCNFNILDNNVTISDIHRTVFETVPVM